MFSVMVCLLFVVCYPFMFMVSSRLRADAILFNGCLAENLQETACGGSVLSTGNDIVKNLETGTKGKKTG